MRRPATVSMRERSLGRLEMEVFLGPKHKEQRIGKKNVGPHRKGECLVCGFPGRDDDPVNISYIS